MIVVHGAVVSPYVRKVRVLCTEKGIRFESRELVPALHAAELLAMNQLGKIPILEDEGTFIPDSSVICAYLERVHPSPALLPEDPKDYARALFLEEWADTKALEAFAPALVERVIMRLYFQKGPDEKRVARARAEIVPPILDWLETQLRSEPASGEGLVGGRFSLADCAVGAQLQSWVLGGEEIDAARWPKVRAYSDSVLSRPSFVAQAAAVAAAG